MLIEKGYNTTRVWDQIMGDNGSVMGLSHEVSLLKMKRKCL